MANLKLKVKDGKFNTNGEWVNAWDPSIDLGYSKDRLKNLPSGVKKIKITHPNKTITYVPFASDGNEYWEKKTHGTILVQNGWIIENVIPKFELKQVQTCHLTIDGKFPLKLREYIKFRIRYNLGPNINGVSTNIDSVWNSAGAFAYPRDVSYSISNPENYQIFVIGHSIDKIDTSIGNERFILIQYPLGRIKLSETTSYYNNVYSIIGENSDHATQWCDASESSDWAGTTAKIYWFLVNNVQKLNTKHDLGIRTPHCDPGGRAEGHNDYITSETTGTPDEHGIISVATRSAGMSLQWQSGLFYTKFWFDDKGKLKSGGWISTYIHSDLSGTPAYDVWFDTNATFNIVRSGEVTLSCTKKRKKIGRTWQQIGEDGYGNPIHGYIYHVSEGEDQTAAYSDYIYIYL